MEDHKKHFNKVISGDAKTKRKSEFSKIANVIIAEDINTVKSTLVTDVIIPKFKDFISELVDVGKNTLLFGEGKRSKSNTISSKVSYRSYYDDNKDKKPKISNNQVGYYYDEIILDNKGDAEEVLATMEEILSTYNVVSVAAFYELVGKNPRYTDYNYGWEDLHDTKIVRIPDGYTFKFPKATPI